MSAKMIPAPERMGSTFSIAIRILGVIAIAQIIVVVWALLMRFDGQATLMPNVAAAAPIAPEPSPFVAPPQPPIGNPPTPPREVVIPNPSPSIPPGVTTNINPTPVFPEPVQPRDMRHHLASPEAQAAVASAVELREKGDMVNALEQLKQADEKEPNHPRIQSELATTYGQMGLRNRETEHWQRIIDMGEQTAGPYHELAVMFFRGDLETQNTDNALRIRGHMAVRDEEEENGQRVMLQIHTESVQTDPIDATDLVLQVYFFDLVDGRQYKATIADVSTHADVTVPYDWRHGTERIDKVYIM
ncbi:MAG: hypothetical protein AAF585_23580 [Verrucomicrobiota bacterium]